MALLETEDNDTLWFDYGIVPDFLVGCVLLCLNEYSLLIQPYTTNFPRADIYELLTPDLLHQAIKGAFKDHLVTWVEVYLKIIHGSAKGSQILDEVDRRSATSPLHNISTSFPPRIALAPPFPGLRRFKQGRNFQQWTGNDSKAFMKVSFSRLDQTYSEFQQVFITALEGFVPVDVTKTLTAFLDFCYIARKDMLDDDSLAALNTALGRFHHHRKIFQETGVRPTGFSLPRQHSLVHYHDHIKKFGAPNGLSSSITELKHITAIKKPWRRSGRYEALGQMLTINTRNDKLAAARIDFSSRGMLNGTCLSEALKKLENTLEDIEGSDGDDSDYDSEDGQDLDADEDEDRTGPVDGPPMLSEVTLAQKRGKHYLLFRVSECF